MKGQKAIVEAVEDIYRVMQEASTYGISKEEKGELYEAVCKLAFDRVSTPKEHFKNSALFACYCIIEPKLKRALNIITNNG